MKKTKLYTLIQYFVVSALVLSLSGCNMAWSEKMKPKIDDETLMNSVAKVIDEQLEIVSPYIEKDDLERAAISVDDITGVKVVNGALTEEQGYQYLEFSYDAVYEGEDNLDSFVAEAKNLLPEEEVKTLDDRINETKKALELEYEDLGRAIPPSQQLAFQKDLRKLITRSCVLFVAGLVYACMPHTMFWGKISAAAAVSVATGVLSVSIMSLYQYYKYGGDVDESFSQWIEEVSTEPQVSYALAASMITVGRTTQRSPVVTGIMICVFSLYKVIDMVKPMLKRYNFSV
jgi:hypothetical protein